jgi:undecaprenyl-diphosphatase
MLYERTVNPLLAALLGVVEGITEYLPISSTGHLILVSKMLGLESEGDKSFDVVIQLGAILAVLVHYRRLLAERAIGLASKQPESVALLKALVVGFVPTAIAGLLLRKIIKAYLFGPGTVAAALVFGGIVMIVVELRRAKQASPGLDGLEHVTPRRAFAIGIGQCFALVPGASRSMCTIIAGQLSGLSTATSAEFSFLLGLPTLGAATVYEAYKGRHELGTIGASNVGIGLVVSFVVAWVVIAGFLAYLKRRGLMPFAFYRIVLGGVILLVILRS